MTLEEALTLTESALANDGALGNPVYREAWAVVKKHLRKPTKYKRPELNLEWKKGAIEVKEACTGRVVFIDFRGAWYSTQIPAGARLTTVVEDFKRYVHTVATVRAEEYRNGRLISTRMF
jgi:hypothetical protein